MKVNIIGLGGIGSILANATSRYLNTKLNITNNKIIINLIDGDKYELKNIERQEFNSFENKAESKKKELEKKFLNIEFKAFPIYITKLNIFHIIDEDDIILMGVDNHSTRKIVSEFSETLNNIIVISGGNEITDGNIQIFIRKGGKNVTANLTEYHPEIKNPIDKSPDVMSCEELSKSEPQLYFTNFMIASFMCSAFYNVIKNPNYQISEVYVDLLTMNAIAKQRNPYIERGE